MIQSPKAPFPPPGFLIALSISLWNHGECLRKEESIDSLRKSTGITGSKCPNAFLRVGRVMYEIHGCRDQATQVVSMWKVPKKKKKKEPGKEHTIKETTGEEKTLKSERCEVGSSLLPLPAYLHISPHACPLDLPELPLSVCTACSPKDSSKLRSLPLW